MALDLNPIIRDAIKKAEEQLKKQTGKDYKVDEAGIILQLRALAAGAEGTSVDKGRVFNYNAGTIKDLDQENARFIEQDA